MTTAAQTPASRLYLFPHSLLHSPSVHCSLPTVFYITFAQKSPRFGVQLALPKGLTRFLFSQFGVQVQ